MLPDKNYDITIGELKQKLNEVLHIPIRRQRLIFNSVEYLEENKKLIDIDFYSFDFYTNNDAIQSNFISIEVIDHVYNKSYFINIDLYRNKIVQIEKLIKLDPKSDSLILYSGFPDNFEYILFYYYYPGKNIIFDLYREQNCGTMKVCIKDLDKKYYIYTDPNEFIANLKKKIKHRTGLTIWRQKLYWKTNT